MRRVVCGLILVILALAAVPASAQTCAWWPWANASWGQINTGPDLFYPNQIYNPTNWDYSFSQNTVLNTPKDTPNDPVGVGGAYALHWFLDAQPPATQSNGIGSGGVYQEISVTSGVEVKYSFWWKGATTGSTWFEFMIIDGPFTTYDADWRSGTNNPWIMRKRTNASFGWEQMTDASTTNAGPAPWDRIPTGSVVTVVLKAGRNPAGAMESFWDNIDVWQNNEDGSRGPNLIDNGDFEDVAAQDGCDNQLMYKDTTDASHPYWLAKTDCPQAQHSVTLPVSPATHDNTSDTDITITGENLETVIQAKLVPVAGGPTISVDVIPPSETNVTSITVTFPTKDAADGVYNLVTIQGASPPCLVRESLNAFTLTCPTSTTITDVSSSINPDKTVTLALTGDNLDLLTDLHLVYENQNSPSFAPVIPLALIDGQWRATFNLDCAPSGTYRLLGTRADTCRPPVKNGAYVKVKTPPAGVCVWQPWAASGWGHLNLGPDLDPATDSEAYDATNWDYTLSQHTTGNLMTLDTPDSSALSFHWFLDSQPPASGGGDGSGGVFQQIIVQKDKPLEYSFDWKGVGGSGSSWFEFLLIDGPFSAYYADGLQEDTEHRNNPAVVRKKSLSASSFGWTHVTDTDDADAGPYGDRPQTITPSGTIATVVLKAGRSSPGSMESLWDNIVVRQEEGPNLIVNGDFESDSQAGTCNSETIFKDPCELNYWQRSTFVQLECVRWSPFADADQDGDVDQADFAAFQACYTGPGSFTLPPECRCFDRPEPIDPNDNIDLTDLLKFEACASGPGVPANPTCGD